MKNIAFQIQENNMVVEIPLSNERTTLHRRWFYADKVGDEVDEDYPGGDLREMEEIIIKNGDHKIRILQTAHSDSYFNIYKLLEEALGDEKPTVIDLTKERIVPRIRLQIL